MRLPELAGYEYEDFLGEDPFGWSFIANYRGSERRVVKILKSQATNTRFLDRYFKILANPEFDISGAASVYDYRPEGFHRAAAYAMPFYGWRSSETESWQLTSLKRVGQYMDGEQALETVGSLGRAIASVHHAGLFHGGLTPAGIFLTGEDKQQQVLLEDFGQIFMGGLQYLEAGDLLFYASPEQISTGDFSNEMGERWDVYAFGVIAFQLLTGHLPRLDRIRQHYLQTPGSLDHAAVIAYGELTEVSEFFLGKLNEEQPVEWPSEAAGSREDAVRKVVERCLEFDPSQRPASMVTVANEVDTALAMANQSAAKQAVVTQAMPPLAPSTKTEPISTALSVEAKEIGLPERSLSPAKTEPTTLQVVESSNELTQPITAVVKGKISHFFEEHPTLRWKLYTAASVAALLFASYFAIGNSYKYWKTRKDLTTETAELKADVDAQAAAYRQALLDKQQSSEQMKSELDSIEDSRSRLMGEAKLARQLLRQTQDSGDEFFELVLENKDTDVPGFRENRARALVDGQKHYERLIEVYGDAPDFIVSTANAFFYLGRIYRELGEFGKAKVSFAEAERRYLALIQDSRSVDVAFVRNLAIAKHSLGVLSMKYSEFGPARHYFTESSGYWREARKISPSEAISAAVNIHENSLAIVECELAISRLDPALDGARSIGAQLVKLYEEEPNNDKVAGLLGKSWTLVGRILEARGDGEAAKDAYKQSSNHFAQALKLNAAIDAYHLGLGNSLARVGLLTNDIDKLNASVEVLGRVISSNPFDVVSQQTLSDVYGVLSRNQRDGGHPNNAINLERKAIAIIRPIIEKNRKAASDDLLYSYSQRLAHLAELLGDRGNFDDSREPLEEAIEILSSVAEKENALAKYRRALAHIRGLVGFACIKSGDKSEAKSQLELAESDWEDYMQLNPEDNDALRAVKWTRDQLRALR